MLTVLNISKDVCTGQWLVPKCPGSRLVGVFSDDHIPIQKRHFCSHVEYMRHLSEQTPVTFLPFGQKPSVIEGDIEWIIEQPLHFVTLYLWPLLRKQVFLLGWASTLL